MEIYINRELSWLKFNRRVLEQSRADSVPLFERLKFISIFTSNLDEFFMVRAGSMYDRSLLIDDMPDNKTGMSSKEQFDALFGATQPLYRLRDALFEAVSADLFKAGVRRRVYSALTPEEKRYLKQYFKREMLPLVSPQIIDAKHPFPHLENKRIYIFALLEKGEKQSYGVIPLSPVINRVVFLPSEKGEIKYLLAEDIILRYIKDIFKLYKIRERSAIRVTRNADVEVADNFSDDDIDYRDYVKVIIKRREKLTPMRLEFYPDAENAKKKIGKIVNYLSVRLGLGGYQCFYSETPLDMSYVRSVEENAVLSRALGNDDPIFYKPLVPQQSPEIDPRRSILAQAEEEDIFLSYPYYSFRTYLRFLEEAAADKNTVSIKITLYRLSENSEVVTRLCQAAENGKDVTAIVELKARFDENNNINWSRRLEEAGCKIIYGVDGLKIHSKITLVTRRDDGEIKYTVHIGTGNYNEKTAKIYTDVGIITSDREICADALDFFTSITLGLENMKYRRFMVAPEGLKTGIVGLIRREAAKGAEGFIRLKMNSLTDKEIIDELSAASNAGVKTDLIIRGICCFQPGVAGRTENIRVHSIVGRFLEHSRIFIFGSGESREVYIGSADLMTRNTTRRIEIIAPVLDRKIAEELFNMTEFMLQDNVKRSVLCSNGEYEYALTDSAPFDSQLYFYNEAYRRAQRGAI